MPQGKRTDRISTRDLEVLEFIARFGAVPRQVVAAWAGTGRTVTQARERRLRVAGLVQVLPAFGPTGPFALATRAGLAVCGRSELRPARFSYFEAAHQAIVARLAAELERSGERVLSEREMLATERTEGEHLLSARLAGRRFHRADLLRLTQRSAAPEAIEIELTAKGARRLDDIVRAWRRAVAERKVCAVVYHCSPPALRAVERAVARTQAGAQIEVRPLTAG